MYILSGSRILQNAEYKVGINKKCLNAILIHGSKSIKNGGMGIIAAFLIKPLSSRNK